MIESANGTTLDLLYHVSRELVSNLDLHTVLVRVLSLSSKYVGAERASALVLDEHQQPFEGAIIIDDRLTPHTVEQLRGTIDHGLAGWVLRHRQPALVTDSRWDERWQQRPDDAAERSGAKAAICVPIMAQEQVVGIITLVHPTVNFFNAEHLKLLGAIADQAGIAIHNAILHSNLQAAHNRYLELFEDNLDPIIITNWAGVILEVNRQAMGLAGWSQHIDIRGLSIENLLGMDANFLRAHESELHDGVKLRIEKDLPNPAGRLMWVEAYIRKITMDQKDAVQWILRDITERKELDLLRITLTESIVHDLRAPLSNVISSLEFMNVFFPPNASAEIAEIVSIATRSAERMFRLINSLLDIDRLESGQEIIDRTQVAPLTLLQEALVVIKPNVEAKNQHPKLDFAEDLGIISVDRDMILRVVINLLDNAVKYTPNEGAIVISAQLVEGSVEIAVKDSGPGIPPEERSAVFNKFYRLRATQRKSGFGLGLSFCKLAVEAHGGRIWVESQPGQGSQFIMRLPAYLPPSTGMNS
jgi:PAS domain S-box-containing protein